MAKFKKGDRVIVVEVTPAEDCDVGQVGTVLEDSPSPWVEFDTPTRYPYTGFTAEGEVVGIAGYCDCLYEGLLLSLPKERDEIHCIEHNGDCWQSVFPTAEAHKSCLHETVRAALRYMTEDCAVKDDIYLSEGTELTLIYRS
jgi:hypothetical protein